LEFERADGQGAFSCKGLGAQGVIGGGEAMLRQRRNFFGRCAVTEREVVAMRPRRGGHGSSRSRRSWWPPTSPAIALATGFANQGHFGNHFRRRYGLPPGEARRDARALVARLSR
jgi:AraC-like DNA-binding protein